VSNYRPIYILSNFSKLFELIIDDHVSHYFKFNLNQHGFTRTNNTLTNLVTFLGFLTLVVRDQREADVYFDLSNAFDFVPHNIVAWFLVTRHQFVGYGFDRYIYLDFHFAELQLSVTHSYPHNQKRYPVFCLVDECSLVASSFLSRFLLTYWSAVYQYPS
jgi:hypothetical protein